MRFSGIRSNFSKGCEGESDGGWGVGMTRPKYLLEISPKLLALVPQQNNLQHPFRGVRKGRKGNPHKAKPTGGSTEQFGVATTTWERRAITCPSTSIPPSPSSSSVLPGVGEMMSPSAFLLDTGRPSRPGRGPELMEGKARVVERLGRESGRRVWWCTGDK